MTASCLTKRRDIAIENYAYVKIGFLVRTMKVVILETEYILHMLTET